MPCDWAGIEVRKESFLDHSVTLKCPTQQGQKLSSWVGKRWGEQ